MIVLIPDHCLSVYFSYKEANVCPVPKTGDLSKVSKYRPISRLNAEASNIQTFI